MSAPQPPAPAAPAGFHIMVKPIGPACNLDCRYCFYLEKARLFPASESFRLPDDVLETFIRKYIEEQDLPEISFAWQGGEPTLLGVDFFRRVVELQAKYAQGKRITNAIQTNGVLLDDEWCAFLAEQAFLVGLSIDGPRELHDRFRVDKQGQPTFEAVMRGMACMQKHTVEFNALVVVNAANAEQPVPVYRFLKAQGVTFMQFIPLVERVPDSQAKALGLDLASPPAPHAETKVQLVTPWSVKPKQYGTFLARMFDEWLLHDVGTVFVQHIDVALGCWMGLGSSLCVFAERCGTALVMEHNGDLYSCDHYVYPQHKVGNVMTHALKDAVYCPQQVKFGNDKHDALPEQCRACAVRFACNGGCPKHRFMTTAAGEPGLNYLCAGYKYFFRHVDPHLRVMANLVASGKPAAFITQMLAQQTQTQRWESAQRNDPCPCGSGRKFKQCCGGRPPRPS